MLSLVLAASFFGLVKAVLVALLAVLNAILAAFAAMAVWKAYLAVGLKVALIALLLVPVVGLVVYYLWGRRVVAEHS